MHINTSTLLWSLELSHVFTGIANQIMWAQYNCIKLHMLAGFYSRKYVLLHFLEPGCLFLPPVYKSWCLSGIMFKIILESFASWTPRHSNWLAMLPHNTFEYHANLFPWSNYNYRILGSFDIVKLWWWILTQTILMK